MDLNLSSVTDFLQDFGQVLLNVGASVSLLENGTASQTDWCEYPSHKRIFCVYKLLGSGRAHSS